MTAPALTHSSHQPEASASPNHNAQKTPPQEFFTSTLNLFLSSRPKWSECSRTQCSGGIPLFRSAALAAVGMTDRGCTPTEQRYYPSTTSTTFPSVSMRTCRSVFSRVVSSRTTTATCPACFTILSASCGSRPVSHFSFSLCASGATS